MKLKALSHYNNDKNTRFGDCILLYNDSQLIVFDCGSVEHKNEVAKFLELHQGIADVAIVVSHNDRDHTDGVLQLLEYLNYVENKQYQQQAACTLEILAFLDGVCNRVIICKMHSIYKIWKVNVNFQFFGLLS